MDPKIQEEKARAVNEREHAQYEKAQRRLGELVSNPAKKSFNVPSGMSIFHSGLMGPLDREQFYITLYDFFCTNTQCQSHAERFP